MKNEDSRDFDEVAKLDLFEHPETGAELVAAYTEDGEEYVITNKKMVRKLMKYVEDDIDIHFQGTVQEDPYNHLQILNVDDYELLQEFHELKPLESEDDSPKGRKSKKRRSLAEAEQDFYDDVDIENLPAEDDYSEADDEQDLGEDDLQDILGDAEFDDLDESMFDEDMMEEDISEDEKQRLQAELDMVVPKNPKK